MQKTAAHRTRARTRAVCAVANGGLHAPRKRAHAPSPLGLGGVRAAGVPHAAGGVVRVQKLACETVSALRGFVCAVCVCAVERVCARRVIFCNLAERRERV